MRKVELELHYQNYIENPPVSPTMMKSQAASNDTTTIDHWRQTWKERFLENHKKFGPFEPKSIGKLFNINKGRPVIVCGSGPSLKHNGALLKDRGDIVAISCLHNFHFFEDQDIKIDYYVTLDSGDITHDEVYDGGKNAPEWYWERTKDRVLLAFMGASTKLLSKWQGPVYYFNCPIPDEEYLKYAESIENVGPYVSTGGNVLGASLYIAKAFFGSFVTALVGADFAFSYDKKFHGWDSKYDASIGHANRVVDVFGNKILTWPSYYNFKCWFDWVALVVPGIYINCTEGGTWGSFPEGNMMAVKQMELSKFIFMVNCHEQIKGVCETPVTNDRVLLF